MSGHSKWSTIKRKKGALDAKRGKIFTTLIKEITVAAKNGGGDESANPRLRQAILKAKSANMPQENIKRAIKKGTGDLPGLSYEEAVYEGYAPGGVAILMEVLTDNKNRTVADIRHLMTKYGGNLGENGSVAWMFNKKGQIVLDLSAGNEETVMEAVLESGAEDLEIDEKNYIISTEPHTLMDVRDSLENNGFEIKSAEVEMVPDNLQKVEGDDVSRVLLLLEALDDNEDIKNVYANVDLDDGFLN
ncbi:MAG: YebC/PmpR family DNA-binding transcriptional regulator [Candidatus Marinimicrobia bacterium]|nr:YebC/PmpR family DNA-binding transcriptional regulator [Candidatus Neomarinimicrobiota bacterium]